MTVEYNFKSLGSFKEVEGIHAGEIGDLSQHLKFSGVELDYFDEKTGENSFPHHGDFGLASIGMFWCLMDQAYTEEKSAMKRESCWKFDKRLSPVKVAFCRFPKRKNWQNPAKDIWNTWKCILMTEIWRNAVYRKKIIAGRMRSERRICVTVDFETLEDKPSLSATGIQWNRSGWRSKRW